MKSLIPISGVEGTELQTQRVSQTFDKGRSGPAGRRLGEEA